jgi:hypothetical protein
MISNFFVLYLKFISFKHKKALTALKLQIFSFSSSCLKPVAG